MTYIEHDRDCNIFKDDRLVFSGGICNCSARYARYTPIMGPHEKDCPYLEPLGKPGIADTKVAHGICYCSADPNHDSTCTKDDCPFWRRRRGVDRIVLPGENGGILIMPRGVLTSKPGTVVR